MSTLSSRTWASDLTGIRGTEGGKIAIFRANEDIVEVFGVLLFLLI